MGPSSGHVQERQRAQHRRQLEKESGDWERPDGPGFGGDMGEWVSVAEAGGMDNLDGALNSLPGSGAHSALTE